MLDGVAAEFCFIIQDEQEAHNQTVGRREFSSQDNAEPLNHLSVLIDGGDAVSREYLLD